MTFIFNINDEHAQDDSCPEGSFCVLFTWSIVTTPLKVGPRKRKTHMNSDRRQPIDRDKANPGVINLPWIKQLPQVYVKMH